MKIILPFLIIGLAAIVFFYFASPVLDQVRVLEVQKTELAVSLDHANKLKEKQDELSSKYNNIDEADKKKLLQFLPNNIDNVRLIIDMNDIAKKYGLTIRNPNIVKTEDANAAATPAAAGIESSAAISFSVSSSYEILKLFLADLAKSLRIVDIESLAFTANDRNLYDYQLTLRTYWLK